MRNIYNVRDGIILVKRLDSVLGRPMANYLAKKRETPISEANALERLPRFDL